MAAQLAVSLVFAQLEILDSTCKGTHTHYNHCLSVNSNLFYFSETLGRFVRHPPIDSYREEIINTVCEFGNTNLTLEEIKQLGIVFFKTGKEILSDFLIKKIGFKEVPNINYSYYKIFQRSFENQQNLAKQDLRKIPILLLKEENSN